MRKILIAFLSTASLSMAVSTGSVRIAVAQPVASSHPITDDDAEVPSITIRQPALEHYSRCMNAAAQNDDITSENGRIVHRCGGAVAEGWFDFLASNNSTVTQRTRTGTWLVRDFGGGICAKKTLQPDGSSADRSYTCEIFQRGP
jgi:hypothetical protein